MTQNKNTLECDNTETLINNCFVCSEQLEQALQGPILVQNNLFGKLLFFLEPFFFGNWFLISSMKIWKKQYVRPKNNSQHSHTVSENDSF